MVEITGVPWFPVLEQMKGGVLHDYIVPGLTSTLIEKGTVRLFESDRDQQESVTPHSHRFDFACLVLWGTVEHRVWRQRPDGVGAQPMAETQIKYLGHPGAYEKLSETAGHYTPYTDIYQPGQWYGLSAEKIHSLWFSEGAKVLFLEGPEKEKVTTYLEPIARDGTVIRTMKVEPWMFSTG